MRKATLNDPARTSPDGDIRTLTPRGSSTNSGPGEIGMRWPKIRIEIPSPIKDAERLIRQLGLTQQVGEQIDEQAAQELAKGSLKPWELDALGRIAHRAAEIKRQKERGL